MESKKYKYQDELKQVAPNLSEIEKKEPFTVYNDYFNELSAKISDRIVTEKPVDNEAWSPVVYRYLTAAVFSVLVLAVSFIYFNRNEDKNTIAEIELHADDLISSGYLLGIEEEYITEIVANGEADLTIYVDNTAYEDYLLEKGFDAHLINEL